MASTEQERIDAVSRYLQGQRASTICRTVGRSRVWLYKWVRRYDPGNPVWAQRRSRRPGRLARRLPDTVAQLVCAIRQRLATTKYAQRGALAIQWELRQLGVAPLPAAWTINRILKRHGLVARPRYTPRGTPYPAVVARRPHHVHQLDLVGPRYLRGGARFYGVHLIDAASNAVALQAVPSKRDHEVVAAVVAAWQRLGRPRVVQVDNELTLRGSNRYPRSFGLFLRLCLALGVEVVFVPEGEPWRNGIIERFNDTYDKLFLRSQWFRDLAHLRTELPRFEVFHNTQHRYAKLGQRTPREVHRTVRPRPFMRPQEDLPWRDGRISFIRLTDHAGTVRFFSERFLVNPALVHEYVTGTIDTRRGRLTLAHQGRVVKVYRYVVTKHSRQL